MPARGSDPRNVVVLEREPPSVPPDSFAIAENRCVVISNERVNSDYCHLVALAPPLALAAKPGQFFHLDCPRSGEDRPFLRRPMSIYRVVPHLQRIEFLYKVQGPGTRGLASLREGDTLNAVGPLGRGFSLPAGARHVLMLARGVGLATMAPLAEAATAAGAQVTALLSARTPELLMSMEYLARAGAKVVAVTDSDMSSEVSSVESMLRLGHGSPGFDYIATCGSNRLFLLAQRLAGEWGLPGEVALEQQMGCALGMCFCCVRPFRTADGGTTYRRVCWDGPVFDLSEAMTWRI